MRDQRLTRTVPTVIAVLVAAVSSACGVSADDTALVEGGAAASVVVLSEQASPDEKAAARELVAYVRKASGAELPVQAEPPGSGMAVLIGPSSAPREIRERLGRMTGEGYVIESLPGSDALVLAGAGRQGTSFAVYDFLERAAGVRWLWPGELGEVVPEQREIDPPEMSLEREPAFVWRALGPGGALWGPLDKWEKERELGVSEKHQQLQAEWERRNRFGGELIYGGHAFGEMLPPSEYGPTHPEYYALVDGERDWKNFNGKHRAQLCTSNPEVVRLVAEYCQRKFDERPELDAVSISPNDGRGFCECDRCMRLDTGETQKDRFDPELGRASQTRVISDRMVRFGNDVAELVAESHPDKKVLLLAYGQYKQPPKAVQGHENLIVQYAVNASDFWHEPDWEENLANLRGWSEKAPNPAVYAYLTQGNYPDMPRLIPSLLSRQLTALHELGYRRYQTQAGNGHACNGLNFYVLARSLWDPQTDVEAVQRDYAVSGFGAAAPAIERYLNRLRETWRERAPASLKMNGPSLEEYEAVAAVYPSELREACRRDLEEARAAVEGVERRRVEFIAEGLRYFELTMDAVDKTLVLARAGWKLGGSITAPAKPDREAFRAALEAWEERERFISKHREDFVLSYLWVRYNDRLRSFNPLERMQRYADKHAIE